MWKKSPSLRTVHCVCSRSKSVQIQKQVGLRSRVTGGKSELGITTVMLFFFYCCNPERSLSLEPTCLKILFRSSCPTESEPSSHVVFPRTCEVGSAHGSASCQTLTAGVCLKAPDPLIQFNNCLESLSWI